MQIIVKNGAFTYTYDTSVNDTIEGGFVEEDFPPVVELLWNVYDKGKIAEALKKGIPAMDYCKDEE